ncbi:MAG: hypothetical protein KJO23_01815 [Bacteroidia bacterium]|nr:hypothetical protein [Bacteroidia bacterium]NNM22039.1 hypothetical protein [Flavobacteriaceae bacterium]
MRMLLVLITMAVSFASNGQYETRGLTSDLQRVDTYVNRNDKDLKYEVPNDYEGSPYYNEAFVMGNIYEGNKLLGTNIPMRFNIFSNEIEVKENLATPNSEAKPLTKSSDIFVKMGNTIIVLIPFNGSDEEGSYFEVLFEGKKVDLMKKVEKEYSPPVKASSSITRDLKAAFTDDVTYFLQTKNGRMYQLPKAKHKKLSIFGPKEPALQAFIDENNLNINAQEDLLRVIRQYDSM